MTASEFSFLALGLILGAVSGAALVELIRARPPAAREIRLTVARDAIPRRSSTLAEDAYVAAGPEPARGGPADRRLTDDVGAGFPTDRRTTVRFGGSSRTVPSGTAARPSMAGAIPIKPDPTAEPVPGRIMEPTMPLTNSPKVKSSGPDGRMVGIPISTGEDPVLGAFQAAVMAAAAEAARSIPAPAADAAREPVRTSTATAVMDRPSASAASGSRRSRPASNRVTTARCAEERRISDERCELATRARALADAAADASRAAQRDYDAHEAAAVTAAWRADPRAIHDAKEAAQGGFRSAVASATTPEQHEAAARDWLSEINRINTEAREATGTAAREHAAAAEIGGRLERLGLEADAARIGAENADAVCLAARVAVADCEERGASDAATFLIPSTPSSGGEPRLDDDERLGLALEAGGEPRIFRLLRGDRAAMTTLVAAIAGDDPDDRRRWQLLLTGLVEAIVADAIEAAALEFPVDHPFWGVFTRAQDRDVVQALASLGYRFDGLGGWTDDRHPSQRDLSLALGYAGLDPMRVRHGPNDEAMDELFSDVTVAADEYLAGIAGDLTLAEMVAMLGRRADGLAEIWNDWGRIRPLLLDET